MTITNQSTGQSREATTTNDGTYVLADVPAGSNKLTSAAKGFRTSQTNNVAVTINTVTRSDIRLAGRRAGRNRHGRGGRGTIQTDSADVHSSLTSSQITQCPCPDTAITRP